VLPTSSAGALEASLNTGPLGAAPGTGNGFMPRDTRRRFVSSIDMSAMAKDGWGC
jgi:hypothetical protein